MNDVDDIVRQRQLAIRRELDRRGIALKAVSYDSRIPMPTLLSYFPGGETKPAIMSMAAIFKILSGNAIPRDLLSLLLPDGDLIVQVPVAIDHDEIEQAARDYLAAKGRAHHPESPDGRELAPVETDDLGKRATRLHVVTG